MLVLKFQKLIILVLCTRIPPPCRLRINVMYFGRPSPRRTSPQWELSSLNLPNSIAPELIGATYKKTGDRVGVSLERVLQIDGPISCVLAEPRFSATDPVSRCDTRVTCVPSTVLTFSSAFQRPEMQTWKQLVHPRINIP